MILVIIYFPVTNSKDAKELHSKSSQQTISNKIRNISPIVKNYKFLYRHLFSPLRPHPSGGGGVEQKRIVGADYERLLKRLRGEIKLFSLACLVPNGSLAVTL